MRRLAFTWITCAVLLGLTVPAFADKRGVRVAGQAPADFIASQTGQSWAVVIGIDEYRDPAVRRLKYAVADAKAVGAELERRGFQVTYLLNQQATERGIKTELRTKLRQRVGKEDRVVVYYAGHGQDDKVEGTRTMGYLLPQDGELDNVPGSGISMVLVKELADGLAAKQVLFLMDACYGGVAGQQTRALPKMTEAYLRQITREKGRQLITAGGADQEALEASDAGHGLFTHYLLRGLTEGHADLNDDGIIPTSELYAYLDSKVFTDAQMKGHSQRPELWTMSAEKGEFVFFASARGTAGMAAAGPGEALAAERQKLELQRQRLQAERDKREQQEGERARAEAERQEAVRQQFEEERRKLQVEREEMAAEKLAAERAQLEAERQQLETERRAAELARQESERLRQEAERRMGEAARQETEKKKLEVASLPSYDAPKRLERDITGQDGAPMVLIPEGSFWMGSTEDEIERVVDECARVTKQEDQCRGWFKPEQPRHQVTLDRFYLDVYEVTNRLFEKFVNATGYQTTAEREGTAKAFDKGKGWQDMSGASWRQPEGGTTVMASSRREHPVVSVSWEDAAAYCRWAGKRLPTEAEWEYAARAGTQTRTWWGNGHPGSRRVANLSDETRKRQEPGWMILDGYDDGYARTSPVGSYEANPWGLHDIIGNAAEWTADWYGGYSGGQERNPRGSFKRPISRAPWRLVGR